MDQKRKNYNYRLQTGQILQEERQKKRRREGDVGGAESEAERKEELFPDIPVPSTGREKERTPVVRGGGGGLGWEDEADRQEVY